VDSEPHFCTKFKAIREKKVGFLLRKSVAGCGRITAEKLGLFPGNLANYEGEMG
jgi:hypothetical protein